MIVDNQLHIFSNNLKTISNVQPTVYKENLTFQQNIFKLLKYEFIFNCRHGSIVPLNLLL